MLKLSIVGALLVALVLPAASALAWDRAICNPATGEVSQPSSFADEAAYQRFLHEHQGSFAIGPGETCHKPAPTPVPTPDLTPTPSATATPGVVSTPGLSTDVPSSGHGQLVAICHWEPTTGLIERRNVQPDQVQKRLDQGDTLMVSGAVCAQPTPIQVVTATPTPVSTVNVPQAPEIGLPEAVPTPAPEATPTVVVTPVPTEVVPVEEDMPASSVPDALPETGGDDGCSYYGTCLPQP